MRQRDGRAGEGAGARIGRPGEDAGRARSVSMASSRGSNSATASGVWTSSENGDVFAVRSRLGSRYVGSGANVGGGSVGSHVG